MAENESSVIEHLIEIETHASSLALEAQETAAKEINKAKAQAEDEYLKKYSAQAVKLEEEFNSRLDAVFQNARETTESFKNHISSSVLDKKAFNQLMDNIFFKKQA